MFKLLPEWERGNQTVCNQYTLFFKPCFTTSCTHTMHDGSRPYLESEALFVVVPHPLISPHRVWNLHFRNPVASPAVL